MLPGNEPKRVPVALSILFSCHVPFRRRPPRMDQLARRRAPGGLRKFSMFSDSRKAQHNSFAHHRATLLFSPRPAEAKPARGRSPALKPGKATALRDRVSTGILGFVRPAARPASPA